MLLKNYDVYLSLEVKSLEYLTRNILRCLANIFLLSAVLFAIEWFSVSLAMIHQYDKQLQGASSRSRHWPPLSNLCLLIVSPARVWDSVSSKTFVFACILYLKRRDGCPKGYVRVGTNPSTYDLFFSPRSQQCATSVDILEICNLRKERDSTDETNRAHFVFL